MIIIHEVENSEKTQPLCSMEKNVGGFSTLLSCYPLIVSGTIKIQSFGLVDPDGVPNKCRPHIFIKVGCKNPLEKKESHMKVMNSSVAGRHK